MSELQLRILRKMREINILFKNEVHNKVKTIDLFPDPSK
jgi:hypothetical protein